MRCFGRSLWIVHPGFRRENRIIHLRVRYMEAIGKCERTNEYIKMIAAGDGRNINGRAREAVFMANYSRVSREEIPRRYME